MESTVEENKLFNESNPEEVETSLLLMQIKKMTQTLKNEAYEPSDLLINNLVQRFVNINKTELQVRRALASLLGNINNAEAREKTVSKLSGSICNIIDEFLISPSLDFGNHIIELLLDACLENFSLGVQVLKVQLENVLRFFDVFLELVLRKNCESNSITENTSQNHIAAIFKCCISVIRKCLVRSCLSNGANRILHSLVERCKMVLIFDDYGWDCCNAAAMAWVIIWRSIYEEKALVLKVSSVLDALLNDEEIPDTQKSHVSKNCTNFPNTTNALSCLSFCNGLMVMLDSDMIVFNIGDEKCLLMHSILPCIRRTEKRCESISSQVVAAKCLLQWTMVMSDISKENQQAFAKKSLLDCAGGCSIMEDMLNYSLDKLEHPTDAIRHHANDMLVNLLQIGKNFGVHGFTKDLADNVLLQNWQKRSTFTALNGLLDHIEPAYIMQQKPNILCTLLTAMRQQSLAPYASETYKRLASGSYSEIGAHSADTQICVSNFMEPLLSTMCNTSSHHLRLLIDYCFAKLLKVFGKNCILYMTNYFDEKFEALSDVEKVFIAFLACMRMANMRGFAKVIEDLPQEKKQFYEDLLSLSLVHQESEIRNLGFAILCESVKPSTLVSTSSLASVRKALPFNVSCQDPAFRQCLLNSIKKLLLQLKGNITQLLKITKKSKQPGNGVKERCLLQAYVNFISWVGKFSINQLYPSAPYPKRITCISVLNLIVTIFSGPDFEELLHFCEVFTSNAVNSLFVLLSDPYEDVKQSSYSLLSNKNLKTFVSEIINEEKLCEISSTALHRANRCMKPEWCTDAAYHLKLYTVLLSDGSEQRKNSELLRVCSKLQNLLDESTLLAEKNLFIVSTTSPMYGILHCLKQLIKEVNFRSMDSENKLLWHQFITRIITTCFRVTKAVLLVVGSVSPEGHLPEVTPSDVVGVDGGLDDAWNDLPDVLKSMVVNEKYIEQDEQKTRALAQTVLICCWRSAKESSLLLQEVTSRHVPLDSTREIHDQVLSWHELLQTGTHLKRQLMEARHRGAFEIAYYAFKAYCPRLWNIEYTELNTVPAKWLFDMLADIENPDKSKELCATRRSAGLPFFMQALLSGNKSSRGRKNFHLVLTKLLSLCTLPETTSLIPKVHSLNVLRGLVKDASLGEEILPYVSQCLQVSLTGFASSVWAVRNSSTLLFSALVTRIFGVKRDKYDDASLKNRLSANEFFSRMPELHNFLLKQLEAIGKSLDKGGCYALCPTLHPVLLLLSRIYPSTMKSASGASLSDFIPLIIRCRGAAVLKSRVAAAIALNSILTWDQKLDILEKCCLNLQHDVDIAAGRKLQEVGVFSSPQNRIHGGLLQISEILKSISESNQQLYEDRLKKGIGMVSSMLCTVVHNLGTSQNHCLLTRSTAIDLFVLTWKIQHQHSCPNESEHWSKATDILSDACLEGLNCEKIRLSSSSPGFTFFIQSATKFLVLRYWNRPCKLLDLLDRTFSDNCFDVIHCFLETVLTEFEQMKQTFAVEDLRCLEKRIVKSLADNVYNTKISILMYELLGRLVTSHSVSHLFKKSMNLLESCSSSESLFSKTLIEFQSKCMEVIPENWDDINELAGGWIHILASSARPFENVDDVRLAVAKSILTNAKRLLLNNDDRSLGANSVKAWMITINLLCDEEPDIRKVASDIVHKIWTIITKGNNEKGHKNVDVLALRYGVGALLFTHGKNHVDACRHGLQNLVTREAETVPFNVDGVSDGGRTRNSTNAHCPDNLPGLFDRSATNTYLDVVAVSRLARAGLSVLYHMDDVPDSEMTPENFVAKLSENDGYFISYESR